MEMSAPFQRRTGRPDLLNGSGHARGGLAGPDNEGATLGRRGQVRGNDFEGVNGTHGRVEAVGEKGSLVHGVDGRSGLYGQWSIVKEHRPQPLENFLG